MKKLLILGAGGHGKVIAEIAEALGVYETVDFADDNSVNAVGRLSDLEKLHKLYDCAFVGIGDNRLRGELINKLEKIGYEVPVLIHPTAYVSKSATIEKGSVLEPMSVVNANTYVGAGCIISVGAVVDHDVTIGNFCHINAGAIIKAGGKIDDFRKLEAGEIFFGYDAARVNNTITLDDNNPFAKHYPEQACKKSSYLSKKKGGMMHNV